MRKLLVIVMAVLLTGCEPSWFQAGQGSDSGPSYIETQDTALDGIGGGQDDLVVEMPFSFAYTSQCTQGTRSSYSHNYNSTRYDIDLDTPNNTDDAVFAPAEGTVHVLNDGESSGFGLHINLELGDGSFLLLGHLEEALVYSGEHVAKGQLIALEGTTGASTGDHVHFGRHTGDATRSAGSSTSVVGLRMIARNMTTGLIDDFPLSEMYCGIPGGQYYRSMLETPRWHPNGTLIKGATGPEVYLIENGERRHISNEEVFHANRHSFFNVAVVSEKELQCIPEGPQISQSWPVRLVWTGAQLWILEGPAGHAQARGYRVPMRVWQGIAESWGFSPSNSLESYADFDVDVQDWQWGGLASYRSGALVKEDGYPEVYVIVDDTAVQVEDWETYLLLDFLQRNLVEVPGGDVANVMAGRVVGCDDSEECITRDRVVSCGGEFGAGGGDGSGGGWDDPDTEVEPDTDVELDTEPDTDIDTEPDTDPDTQPVQQYFWYVDLDEDGYGRMGLGEAASSAPTQWHVRESGDCKDSDPHVYPGAEEICNDLDDDCDNAIDEGLVQMRWYQDLDGDGHGNPAIYQNNCAQPSGFSPSPTDSCDDNRLANTADDCFPESDTEVDTDTEPDTEADTDEDTTPPEPMLWWYLDADGDFYGRTDSAVEFPTQPTQFHVLQGGDCNDLDSFTFPGALEVCDDLDNNCDSQIDEDGICNDPHGECS